MTDTMTATAAVSRRPLWWRLLPGASAGAVLRVVQRNTAVSRKMWIQFGSLIAEPLLFLLSIGVGVGALVGDVHLADGTTVPYRVFAAAGLLASSAMFGPTYDTTFGFFIKLKYGKLYDGMLATPLTPSDIAGGELVWSVGRGLFYAACFVVTMVAMGLVWSWWAVLAVPVAGLIAFAFAAVGLAATTWMRSYIDFDLVIAATLPLFLFSTIFFPLERYPAGVRWLVQITPLYQGVVIERALVLGNVGWSLLVPALYLVAMGSAGLWIASRRVRALLQP